MQSVIEQAIQLEEKAEKNYRTAARKTTDPGAQKILDLLAEQEAEHAKALRQMGGVNDLSSVDLIEQAKGWIKGTVEGGLPSISSDAELLDVLNRAMDIEHQTETFYEEQGARAEDPAVSTLFSRLARIEREHYLFVGSLVEYFNRPQEWVEDAEFGLRDEY